MKDIGSKLFDARSSQCLNKINICKKNEIPETFDSEYYLDQLDPSKRKKFIHIMKMTKEYIEEERQKQLKLARKLARELSARWVNPEVGEYNIQDEKNDLNDERKDGEEGNDAKDNDGEDNDEDYREASLNVSAGEVFFLQKKQGYPVHHLRSKTRKNSRF